MPADCALITAEIDEQLASAVRGLADIKREFFSGEPRPVWTEVVLPDLHNSLLAGTRTNEEDL